MQSAVNALFFPFAGQASFFKVLSSVIEKPVWSPAVIPK
jgi:hypothetical protein